MSSPTWRSLGVKSFSDAPGISSSRNVLLPACELWRNLATISLVDSLDSMTVARFEPAIVFQPLQQRTRCSKMSGLSIPIIWCWYMVFYTCSIHEYRCWSSLIIIFSIEQDFFDTISRCGSITTKNLQVPYWNQWTVIFLRPFLHLEYYKCRRQMLHIVWQE